MFSLEFMWSNRKEVCCAEEVAMRVIVLQSGILFGDFGDFQFLFAVKCFVCGEDMFAVYDACMFFRGFALEIFALNLTSEDVFVGIAVR